MKHWITSAFWSGALLLWTGFVFAEPKPTAEEASPPQSVRATFLITGLHCPPCTRTVEQSLKSVKGVKSVEVDWKTKNAKVEFDEQQIGAQQIAGRIAATPHMMGGKMRYGGWLALRVPDIATEGNAEKAKEALTKVTGVSKVKVYPQQKSVGVAFDNKGTVKTPQLIEALKEAGLDAAVLP